MVVECSRLVPRNVRRVRFEARVTSPLAVPSSSRTASGIFTLARPSRRTSGSQRTVFSGIVGRTSVTSFRTFICTAVVRRDRMCCTAVQSSYELIRAISTAVWPRPLQRHRTPSTAGVASSQVSGLQLNALASSFAVFLHAMSRLSRRRSFRTSCSPLLLRQHNRTTPKAHGRSPL